MGDPPIRSVDDGFLGYPRLLFEQRRTVALVLLGSLAGARTYASVPNGWSITGSAVKSYEIGAQPGDRHANDSNAYIRSIKDANGGFASLMQAISAEDYRGKRVRLSGYLKSRGADKGGLWMRVDDPDRRPVQFDNMLDQRAVRGDTDWHAYSVVLDVPMDARDIALGFLLEGNGALWADDFKLEVVGQDVPTTGTPLKSQSKAPVNMGFLP